jgi:hypothetical protein
MEIHNSKLVYTSLAAKSKEDLECQVGGHNSPSLRSIIIYIYNIYIYTIYIYCIYIYTIYIYNIYIYIYIKFTQKTMQCHFPSQDETTSSICLLLFFVLERGDHRFSRFNLKLLCESLIA